MVYSMLFGLGNILFGRIAPGLALITYAAALGTLFWSLNRQGWSVFK